MGDNRWRDEQEWPLARATYTPYYFHSQGKANRTAGDGRLTTAKPEAEPPDHYAYDPNDPTPFILVPGALQLGTTEDQRAVEARSDVLVFTSDPLPDSLEVTGPIRIKLWAASSAPDTDWTGKLVDVHPDGYAQRLLDGIIRARFRESYEHPTLLQPQKIYEYTIDLWATSNVFLKGHQIRVEIASASFPKFARNLNTGESNEESTRMQVAQQTVYHDAAHPSHVLLPIIPRP
jgi:putative CocE/NonD family hydrolase